MQRDRKKEHKKVIKYMRIINKHLLHDEYIGCGRFRLDLIREDWYRYEDGSGGDLMLIFKISDKVTGNWAYFDSNNYGYMHKINTYLNDFMIRCSSGHSGHFPKLHYIAYDVHDIVKYAKEKHSNGIIEDGIIDTYNWIG